MLFRASETQHRIGLTVLRIIVGIVFFVHGWQKLTVMGHEGVTGFFTQVHVPLPGLAAWYATFAEVAGGLALVLGAFTRVAAALLAVDMLGAIMTVHIHNGFSAAKNGYEFVLVLLAAAVTLAIAGGGAPSVDDMIARRNTAR